MKNYNKKEYNHLSKRWEYKLHGKIHRVDGPAIISQLGEMWMINGIFHRLCGPAIISGDYKAYYIDGVRLEFDDWNNHIKVVEKRINDDFLFLENNDQSRKEKS